MIDRDHDLSLSRQAKALRVSRGAVYYKPRPVSAEDLKILRRLDERKRLADPLLPNRF